jgi:hypothetical protein
MGGLRLTAALFASVAGAHPALTIAHGSVHAAHFRPREKVRVTVTASVKVVRTVKTTSAGTFAVTVPALADPCTEAVVLAVGATGDHARLKVMPRGCLPPGSTP